VTTGQATTGRSRAPTPAWLAATVALLAMSWGCGGLPPVNDDQPGGAVVVLVAEAETNAQLDVPAVVIVGGVRGVLSVGDLEVVLRDVPLGTGSPPAQPMTVTAEGYVTLVQQVQLNVTTATWVQVAVEPADTALTGTISGTVTDEVSGEPITSAFAQFTPPGANEPAVGGYTDRDGAFVVGGIPAGDRDVTVQAADFLPFEGQTRIRADDVGTNDDLNVTLVRGDTTVTVRGIVVDVLTQRVIAGAQVTIAEGTAVVTGADGRFEVADVLVGDQRVQVSVAGYEPHDATVTILPGMGDITVELFESAQDPPGGPHTIAGTVTLNGPPDSSGATVSAVDLATTLVMDSEITGPSGRYGLFVPPGGYEVTVVFGQRRLSREITVPPGGVVMDGIDFILTVQ